MKRLNNMSLRLRIFLFFGLIAVGGTGIVSFALWIGYQRTGIDEALAGFVTAGVFASFGMIGLSAAIWLLFDENIARPVLRLSAQLRARIHGAGDHHDDPEHGKYLGDLALAISDASVKLGAGTMETAEDLARQTAHLEAEKQRLADILTGIPTAVMLVSPSHNLVLYDGQAAAMLEEVRAARLNSSIFDYFEPDSVLHAVEMLADPAPRHQCALVSVAGHVYTGFIRSMGVAEDGEDAGYMLMLDALDPDAERPLTYDFELMLQDQNTESGDLALRGLSFVVVDTETTGLDPRHDALVQIGAVRVVNGKVVAGEQFQTYVNPERPIPAVSTRVHKITNAMVAGAPKVPDAVRDFACFAEGAALVAHNAPFDLSFLRRAGVGAFDHPILDTVLLSAIVYGADVPHTLDALAARLEVTIPEELRHTALGDAQATAEVLTRLLPMLEDRGILTFADLLIEMRKFPRLMRDMNG